MPPKRRWLKSALIVIIALAVCAAIPFLIAYRNVAIVGSHFTLRSQALAMDRRITIYVPAGYDADSRRLYPVLYSLDGQSFRHDRLPAIWVRVLAAAGLTHPAIVVAINNEGTRDIDLRPPMPVPADNNPPIAGRDAAFTAFLQNELIPFVDRRYRTSAYRIISGHSLGGLYAVDCLSRSPGLFQAHFAYSPTFTHDLASLARLQSATAMRRAEPTLLYMNIGEESGLNYMRYFYRAARPLTRASAEAQLIWKAERVRGLYHPIVMIPGQARALMMLGEQASPCALAAGTDAIRRACY